MTCKCHIPDYLVFNHCLNYNLMLIDSHIHVGQFFDKYIAPYDLFAFMKELGVDYYAVSSTTICEENYPKAVQELQELIAISGSRVLPTMWITPYGLEGNIAWYLETDIKWKLLKIHPELHPNGWSPDGTNFHEVLDISRELSVPLLIHTGNAPYCHAGLFRKVIEDNSDVVFILAHGRPLKETISILEKCNNAYVDSAFMDVDSMLTCINSGFAKKLLWGTDMCIPLHFYPQVNLADYYRNKLDAFRRSCFIEDFNSVVFFNACRLFNI